MRKSKKLVALLLGMSMIATCFSACGSGGGEATPSATATAADNSVNNGGNVKVDLKDMKKFVEAAELTEPEKVADNADAQQVDLTVWGPTEEQTILTELCQAFDDSHPEFKINFTIAAVSEDKAASTVANDPQNSADVFMFAGDQLGTLVDASYISPINDSIASQVKEEHIETAYDACVRNDKLYAIPFTANLWYLFYNKSLLTADEVKSLDTIMAKDLGTTSGGDKIYNFGIDIGNGWYIASFFYAGGCTLYGADGSDPTSCDWAEEKGIAVVDYISSLVKTGNMYKDANADSIGKLEDGTLASFVTGSWNAKAIGEKLGDNYAAAVAPTIKIGDNDPVNLMPFADYKMIGINTLCENQKAAQMLAQFLAQPYAQVIRIGAREIQPTCKQLIGNSALDFATSYPAVQASLDQLQYTVARPSTTQIQNFWTPAGALGGCIYNQKEEVLNADRATYIQEKIVNKIIKSE